MKNNPAYRRIRFVSSFDELVSAPFADGINALCWSRELEGDFAEVVARIADGADIITLDPDDLMAVRASLSPAGQQAIDAMMSDYKLLESRGLDPCLDCIPAYARDVGGDALRTDVYSFHADRAPVQADTYLCTYTGGSSEGLPNEQAIRHVDIEETRAALLAQCRRDGGTDFAAYLSENSYDLHYRATDDAQIYQFGIGNLWRIAIEYPDCPVPPCIHRAPEQKSGDAPRLLLIS